MITTTTDNKQRFNIISNLATTIKTPEITTKFYDELESVVKLTKNAKTKPNNKMLYENYNNIIGKYGHGIINENGISS